MRSVGKRQHSKSSRQIFKEVEIFYAAIKEKEVWDLKVVQYNVSGSGQRKRASLEWGDMHLEM